MEPTKNTELPSFSNQFLKCGQINVRKFSKETIQGPVSELIIKESGLKGGNMSSLSYCVTIKFVDSQLDPLHIFV